MLFLSFIHFECPHTRSDLCVIFVEGGLKKKFLFCCNLSYVTLGQNFSQKKKTQCCKLFYFEMNVIY